MLTAAVASADLTSSAQLQAWLQQTGMISSVRHWAMSGDQLPEMGHQVPDVVLLDLGRDPEPYFNLGSQLRRLYPSVRLVACSSSEPDTQLLLAAMRSGVQDVLPKPIDLKTLQGVLARFLQELQTVDRRTGGTLLLVMGAKGGVGTTTVAVNLAVQMAQLAKDGVVLLDFARPLGVVQLLLDLKSKFGIRDAVESLERLDSHFFAGLLTRHSSSLQVLSGATQLEHWQSIDASSLQRVVNVALTSFGTAIIDYGSHFSAEWAPVLKQATILLVAEANVPALWALERRLFALAGFGLDPERIRVVINRWRRADQSTLTAVEKNMKRPVFACLPNDYARVSEAINLGEPLMASTSNGLAVSFRQLAAQLAGIELERGSKRNTITTLFSSKR